ncbi:Isoquinoline 1-oxidoreductase subunit alpha [bioreactor metagenome]|uniref:Isoquinoline 1-oxidoreductase subunit alpha n=1 Tax=bioreactor metagenome TaxID=1076179 RepID=A0A644XQN4_9ZZZZ
MTTQVSINGQDQAVQADPQTPLLWVLRDELGMTGTKFGCGMALCGACTVHMDGGPIRSCVTPVSAAAGKQIRTIEHMENDRVGRAVQGAWVALNVAQCGYCQAGQIMSAIGLLRSNASPSDEDINNAMSGNLCRCGTYNRIHAAVKHAATQLAKGGQ